MLLNWISDEFVRNRIICSKILTTLQSFIYAASFVCVRCICLTSLAQQVIPPYWKPLLMSALKCESTGFSKNGNILIKVCAFVILRVSASSTKRLKYSKISIGSDAVHMKFLSVMGMFLCKEELKCSLISYGSRASASNATI